MVLVIIVDQSSAVEREEAEIEGQVLVALLVHVALVDRLGEVHPRQQRPRLVPRSRTPGHRWRLLVSRDGHSDCPAR